MRLIRFGPPGHERPGLLLDDVTAVDVGDHVDDYDPAFFAAGGLDALRDLDLGPLPTIELTSQRLGPPLCSPGKIVCVGLNYRQHAEEADMDLPAEPTVFFKATSALVGPDDDLLMPIGGEKLDWEIELAVVIAKRARYLPNPAASLEHIAGYAVANDVSERAFQLEREGQWVKGKSAETFNPLGPWLATVDEIEDPQQLSLRLAVNGEVRQDSSTSLMVFSVSHIIWYLSQFMVLEPGDVINTGTPPGVGLGMDPPVWLKVGDVVEATIDRLGQQRQTVHQARLSDTR